MRPECCMYVVSSKIVRVMAFSTSWVSSVDELWWASSRWVEVTVVVVVVVGLGCPLRGSRFLSGLLRDFCCVHPASRVSSPSVRPSFLPSFLPSLPISLKEKKSCRGWVLGRFHRRFQSVLSCSSWGGFKPSPPRVRGS